jgi:hypothetical protein
LRLAEERAYEKAKNAIRVDDDDFGGQMRRQ